MPLCPVADPSTPSLSSLPLAFALCGKVKLLTMSSSLTMGVFGTLKEVVQVRN